jgi:hypothetical protein
MEGGIGERDSEEVVALIHGIDGENALRTYYSAQRRALANYVACIQSIHALSDTLAHVIYFGLAMALDKATRLKDRDISLYNVWSKLSAVPDGVNLQVLLKELREHPEFRYLNRLTNLTKHRAIMDARHTVSLVEGEPDGFRLPSFKADEETYPARWLEPVLSSEFRRQNVLHIDIGCELNDILAKRLSACPP